IARTPRRLPEETRRIARATQRSGDCHRRSSERYRKWRQVHESVPSDEDVQRRRTEPRALSGKKIVLPKQVKHIAVIRFSAMGDVAMTVPVLDCIARKYDVKLTMVSRPFLKPLFSSVPNLDFFPADFKNYYKGFFGLIRLYRDLKKRKVDAVADLHDVIRSKVIRTLFVLGGIPVASIDKGRTEKKALTRIENKEFRQLRHSVDRYADVFEKLGFPVNPSDYRATKLPLTENVLSVVGQKNQKWIGIAPFAQHEGKVYPEDLMRDVIN